ncbi:hypothetical protein KDL01_34115 [Actinospica durhamensis]|uniref:Uncharacterized protein n=1 Tax=Actinospica durhamensis TaxID=1508375 RepID=A0A941EWQ2_9ACTN|nr:hypothetical protein [Actinospica durhamensis]MBR7838356.1 hypothetical protein [Actinospica durhamensis]
MAMEWKKHQGAAAIILLAAAIIAGIIVLHIIFVVIGANGHNSIVSTIGQWSSHLAAWFKDLFNTNSARWNVVLNYGLAALAYLFVGRLAASLVERV